jgi:hypothetical protein
VAKNVSTSFYGNIVALSESPKKEGLIYAGTDDGLIQITENGGTTWQKVENFPGIPERTYVSRLFASQHEPGTVYASFDNHKNADFKPYLLKSSDSGRTWRAITSDLPANGPVLAIAEDPIDGQLLFVGTEFGVFFSANGGGKWIRLKGDLPTIAVRDLAIQKQMSDLVLGTFGRGFYVLDDYSALRGLTPATLEHEIALFPTRDAWLYIQTLQYGLPGKAFQGSAFYSAANPPFGATFTYHLKEALKTRKQQRQDEEKAAAKKSAVVPYPTHEQLRAEDEEEPPALLFTIADATGHVVRTLTGPVTQGFHRVTWDLREPAATLPRPRPEDAEDDLFYSDDVGPLVMPGTYKVSVAKRVRGVTTPLIDGQAFNVVVDGLGAVAAEDRKALFEFQQQVVRLERAVEGTLDAAKELSKRIEQIKKALDHTPAAAKDKDAARALEQANRDILRSLRGDTALRARNENTPISIAERVETIVESERMSLAKPTTTARESYRIAGEELTVELAKLRKLVDVDLRELEKALDLAGAPWTPGRLPEWKEK